MEKLSKDYHEMLEELYQKMPPRRIKTERFRVPAVESFIHGNKTVFVNFKEIAEYLNRDTKILRVYLAKELAVPVSPSNGRLVLHGKIDNRTLQSAIEYFVKKYVICPVCEGPDTKLIISKKNWVIKCEICGAESPVLPVK